MPNSSEHNLSESDDDDNNLDSIEAKSAQSDSVAPTSSKSAIIIPPTIDVKTTENEVPESNVISDEILKKEVVENEMPENKVLDNESSVSSTVQPNATVAVDPSPRAAHVTAGNSMTPISRLTKTPKMIANGSRAFMWYALALVVLVIDQWTKWLAETNLTFNEPVPVIEPFLNWTLAYNYGAAFSFLADAGGWQKWFFSGLALVMSLFLIIYLIKAPRKAKLLSIGLALVLGGAVGNLIDRLLHGHVIDFIHVHNADVWHYPIFNIADMGISVGVAMIVIDMIFLEKKRSA